MNKATKNDNWHKFAAHSVDIWATSFIKSASVEPIDQTEKQSNVKLSIAAKELPDKAVLFFQMQDSFDLEDLKTFCTIILSIDIDELPGEKKSAKIRELIKYSLKKGIFNKVQQLFVQYKDQL